MANSALDILQDYSQKMIDALKDNLNKKDRFASGMLSQSITANVKVFNQVVEMTISMEDYWKFVDEGVDGTVVKWGSPYKFKKKNLNQKAMLKHIANRGLRVTAKKGVSKENARKGLAFVLGRSIAKKGIKPTHFASEVFEGDLMEDLSNDLAEALGRDILIDITVD